MSSDFFKFPSTPHLALLGDIDVRGDKVLSEFERDEFLKNQLTIEEKVDGANLGISFDDNGNLLAQNRGEYLNFPTGGQWKKLQEWLVPRSEILLNILSSRYMLFGEWCYAQHSVFYDQLPDWFLGFDIYDKQTGHFLSCDLRDEFFKTGGISSVPILSHGVFSFKEVVSLLLESRLSDTSAEGIYLRYDNDNHLIKRAKLVRPGFTQQISQHWSRMGIKGNKMRDKLFHGES